MPYKTEDELRGFLCLCLDPGPGRTKRTAAQLAAIMPDPVYEALIQYAPNLVELREHAGQLAEQATAAHHAYAEGLVAWIRGDEPKPVRRRKSLLESAMAAVEAAQTHIESCADCRPDMRLPEMCPDGQRQALAAVDDGPECAHASWEVTSEYRNARQMWVKSRRCADCGEHLEPLVDREPHWPDKALSACPGFEKEYQGVSDAKRRLPNCKYCRQPRAAHSDDR
ncbi:hypothetical protein [Streptomyces europaeiscabiei]|uniref:hypothetical protein n=1 Tax=Streptomyces europaeiscabiei TaxID=146819 RepID=UPI002E1189F9|nr:hypothetical protein OHB30_33015 [Streptomyces europaeiscabiei]